METPNDQGQHPFEADKSEDERGDETARPRSVLWRAARFVVTHVLLPLLLIDMGYRCLSDYLVTRADREATRNPQTGVLVGSEARTLGMPGSNRAALLVHGFVGAGNNFANLPDRLASMGWRVRVMRLPGHGTSPRDFEKVTADELLTAVRKELAALKREHSIVVLMGHSMGGALCTLAAGQDGADALVLGAPYFGVTHHWYYLLPAETWTRIGRPLARWIYKGQIFMQVNRAEVKLLIVSYAWVPVDGLLTLQEIGRRANDPAILRAIHCPVLLIHAAGDAAASIEASQRTFAQMASEHKRFLQLTKSNHHIFWDFEQEQVMSAIEEFLDNLFPASQRSSRPD